MAIEVIDTIKPKNNGNFPIVDASDVNMPDGTRLSEVNFDNLGGDGATEIFPVAFGFSTETLNATCEVTYSEITTVVAEGKFVYGILDLMGMPVVLPFKGLISLDVTFALFETAVDFMGAKISVLVRESGEVETLLEELSDGGTNIPPTSVDMSRFESEGVIEETFADGSVKTTTINVDSDGNPISITDGDGNVTEFTW
jgi:hypothetical protein